MRIILIFVVSLFAYSCSSQKKSAESVNKNNRNSSWGINLNEEKCYVFTILKDRFETVKKTIPIYTGQNPNTQGIELQKIILEKERFEWVEKDISDCGLGGRIPNKWCRVFVNEKMEIKYVVTDTSKIKSFTLEEFEEKILIEEGGLKWLEIACDPENK